MSGGAVVLTVIALVATIPLLVALTLLFVSVRNWRRYSSSKHWLSTKGLITGSSLQVSYDNDGPGIRNSRASYTPRVEYEYFVQGAKYSSKRFAFGPGAAGSRSRALEMLNEYRSQAEVTVFYHPDKPQLACLQRRLTLFNYLFAIIGVFFLGVYLTMFSTALLVFFG